MIATILTVLGAVFSIILVVLNNKKDNKGEFDAESKKIADDIASQDISRINSAVQRLRMRDR